MNQATKIATCTYCGTKTAIVLAAGARHELTCSACAAPLDQMELLQTSSSESGSAAGAVSPAPIAPTTPPQTSSKRDEKRKTKSAGFGLPWPDWKSKDDDDDDKDDKRRKPKKSKKRKKRKSLAKKLFEEAADKIEDIFD